MKRDVSSVYFGIIVGLSLGFVLCNVVHAEPTGVWAYPLGRGEFVETGMACTAERVGYSYLTADHQLLFCYGEKGWGIVNFIKDIPCLATMEAAMRAREEWAALTDERDRWILRIDGTETITFSNPIITYDPFMYPAPMPEYHYEPDRRTDEERLADKQRALDEEKIALAKRRDEEKIKAYKEQEKLGRIVVLKAQWELGKACWRKP